MMGLRKMANIFMRITIMTESEEAVHESK